MFVTKGVITFYCVAGSSPSPINPAHVHAEPIHTEGIPAVPLGTTSTLHTYAVWVYVSPCLKKSEDA